MLHVALTGGIASGKTTVSNLFASLGTNIIDCDELASQLTRKQTAAYEHIVQHFGQPILNKDLSLNRHKLADIIFTDPQQRTWLEELLHPAIKQQVQIAMKHSLPPYTIIVVPLLLETGWQSMFDRICVVDCAVAQQTQRLIHSRGYSPQKVENILSSQVTREQRLKHADDIIQNTTNLEQLAAQVTKLDLIYRTLSSK